LTFEKIGQEMPDQQCLESHLYKNGQVAEIVPLFLSDTGK